ncbi:MAG TPA: hypothetical protein VEL07_11680 [Planctomycetota bacterium]|nr:hypothetical protein [Planctomycetota bacterium]
MSISCGTGRRVINPEIGHVLCGYGPYANTGVHDDIVVTALWLDDGQQRAVLLNYDLIGLRSITAKRIRTAVARTVGIPMDRVFTVCTHVHSGPNVIEVRVHGEAGPNPECRADYLERLLVWSTEAAADAKSDGEDCILRYNFTDTDGNMNRRFNFPDRRGAYIPDNKQLIGQSREYVDRELGIIAFRKKGTLNRYKAIITNYTCHPLCVGNSSDLVTADFPGVLRRTVEETFAGSRCLTTTGAAGDNHPLMPESGFASAEDMGRRLGRLAIMRAYDSVAADDQSLRLAHVDVAMAVRDETTAGMQPEAFARTHPLKKDRAPLRTEVSLIGIGPVLLAGFPGEPMAEQGAMLKWQSPFLKTYALFTATDNLGYFPTTNQFLWGGYETNTSLFAHSAGDGLVRDILTGAHRLVAERPLTLSTTDGAFEDGSPAA